MQEVANEVYLVGYPLQNEAENIIYFAARQCYWPGDIPEETLEGVAFLNSTSEEREKLIRSCIKSGHESVLEHIQFTFRIKCTRACGNQLVRHRLASYSQQSQRYCKFDSLQVITPDTIKKNRAAHWIFKAVITVIEFAYRWFTNHGIPAEDARAILPNCMRTEIVTTMNARQLRHFFQLRCCNRAQSEIRRIANTMLEQCKDHVPVAFETAGPKCLQEKRCTEQKPCGLQPWKNDEKSNQIHR